MALQGFDKNTLARCNDALRVQASGNAYPVPLLMAVLAPMLEVVQKHVEKRKPAIKKLESEEAVATCTKFMQHMEKFKAGNAGTQPKKEMKPMKTRKNTKKKTAAKKKVATRKVAVKKKAMKKSVPKQKKKTKKYRWISSSSS